MEPGQKHARNTDRFTDHLAKDALLEILVRAAGRYRRASFALHNLLHNLTRTHPNQPNWAVFCTCNRVKTTDTS
jgi:hypothetical protein